MQDSIFLKDYFSKRELDDGNYIYRKIFFKEDLVSYIANQKDNDFSIELKEIDKDYIKVIMRRPRYYGYSSDSFQVFLKKTTIHRKEKR